MKGQLSHNAGVNQAKIESPLGSLGIALALIEHIRLRIRQATGRYSGLLALLGPALCDLDTVAQMITRVQDDLREIWEQGQSDRWK